MYNRASDSQFVTVLVGPEKKPFVVHRDLLIYHSDFFRAALTSNFEEAKNKNVTLPDDEPTIFEFFVHWLYHKELPTTDNAPTELLKDWETDDCADSLKVDNIIYLYVLGDKRGVANLKLATLAGLFQELSLYRENSFLPNPSIIGYAYENLPVEHPLLRYLVDAHCYHVRSDYWLRTDVLPYPLIFLMNLMSRYAQFIQRELSAWDDHELDLCDYHDHKDKDEKAKCRWSQVTTCKDD
ncbi:hypothetical protein N0V86_006143 [Didymella sp. IMI 355093]|nr:hypothetical protein N0V86_006143 [Didymella sp. IMI 355093]